MQNHSTSYLRFVLFFLFFPCSVFAQQRPVKGIVLDKDEKPIPNVNIAITGSLNNKELTFVTDDQGYFDASIDRGSNYYLSATHVSYTTYEIGLPSDMVTDSLWIYMTPKTNELEEATVNADRPRINRKIDRLVFNVDQAASASGGNALDALRVTPNVQVQESGINIVGKSGAQIMINERPVNLMEEALVTFLSSLKSDDIKSIEVISNPGAKYDAEGSGGLINLVMKQSLPESWNAGVLTSFSQATYGTGNFGGSFNLKKNKSTFSLNGSYIDRAIKRKERDRLYYPEQDWDTDFDKKKSSESLGLRAAYDIDVNKKLSTGVEYVGSYNKPKTIEVDLGTISRIYAQTIDSLIDTRAENGQKQNSSAINIHTIYKFDTLGKALFFSADYFDLSSAINRDLTTQTLLPDGTLIPESLLSTTNDGNQRMKNYSAKIDFDYPTNIVDLSFGGKISMVRTNNNLSYYRLTETERELNVDQSNEFRYHENTQALYVSGRRKFGSKWESQAGIRLENTQIEGNSITYQQINKNSYLKIFPTLFLLYSPNKNNTLGLEYGRRINRPGFSSLNPFRFYSSPYSYSEGNPFLLPQYADNLSLRYDYKRDLWFSLSYLRETNGFGEVPKVDVKTRTQYFTQLNYFTYNRYRFSVGYIFHKIKWWTFDTEAFLFNNKSAFDENLNFPPTSGWGTRISSINTFNLDHSNNLKAGFHFTYNSKIKDLLYENASYSSTDLFLRYGFLNNKLIVSARAQDIFKSSKISKSTYTSNIYQVYSSYNDNRSFRLSISYNFGNVKIRNSRSRSGNQEERERSK